MMTGLLIYAAVNIVLGLCICTDVCPPGEEYTECIQSQYLQMSCSQIEQPIPYSAIEYDSCTDGCVCSEGYLRDDNGICIPEYDCPAICPPNEELSNCTQIVCRAQNCQQKGKSVPCTAITADSCQQGCVCVSGTLRNDYGVCIPEDECEGLCPPGEEFTDCIQAQCRAQDCTQLGQSLACPRIDTCDCISGCVCPDGSVRDQNGTCIPAENCPGQTCSSNEEFYNCTQTICRPLDCFQKNTTVTCEAQEEQCESGCVCQAGYLRTIYGDCVPEDRCYEDLVCDENETVDTCPGSCTDFCPTSEDDDICSITDPTPDSCGAPKCRCRFNYKRDVNNGTCIPTSDCPSFDCSTRPNEEYDPCPPACPTDDCSQASPSGRCPIFGRIGIVLECEPKCRCIEGYWRNNGICVPYADCPGVCPENEELSNCMQALCRAENCTQINQPIPCSIIFDEPCQEGCVCVAGTLRDENGNCIPEDQCPGQICDENETLNECPNACDNDACPINANDRNEDCIGIALCLPPQCQCNPNYKRDDTGACIPIEDCPGICPINEEYSNCTQAVCRALNCYERGQPIACSAIEDGACESGCVCQDGFLRTADGDCVSEDRCFGELVCDENETVDTCPGSCSNDFCPTSDDTDNCQPETTDPSSCGDPICTCRFNYKRDNDNGTCIPTRDCPAFDCSARPNEEYNSCPPLCPTDDCSQASPSGRCLLPGRIGIILECEPTCRCIQGYWRDNGTCVPYAECPEICPASEEYSSCTQALCRAQNCSQINQPIACPRIAEGFCQQGCVCVQGTLRDEFGNCIPEDQCPEQICGENEQYNECTSVCNTDACPTDLKNVTEESCIDICGPPKCECIPNYKRNENGDCVPIEECPEICSADEEYSSCTQALCRAQNCSQINQPIACPRIAEGFCQQGCVCVQGTLRDEFGNCIPEDQCPEQKCGENEQYNECTSVCNTDACPTDLNDVTEEPCIDICGPPKCECIQNYKRNENGNCIPIEECPEICPANEEYSSCTQALCRAQNCSQINQPIACPRIAEGFCQQGCVCVQGTLRDEFGNCIPEDQCPEQICGENEQYNECTSVCNTDACPTDLNDVTEEPCIIVCGPPKCECIQNYKRNENGNCIPIEECPEICPANEEYSSCTQALCRAQNCSQINQPIACPLIVEAFCQQGCVCVQGTLRDEFGNCIPEDQCPEQKCGENEQFNECTSVCNTDACPTGLNNVTEEPCITVCGPPKCECIQNYKRNDNGDCVPIEECPGICPNNEEYSNCPQSLCRLQNCEQAGQTVTCLAIEDEYGIEDGLCQPGCVCIQGTLRDENGNCVPENQCPGQICGENEELNECTSVCYSDACPINLNDENVGPCILICGPQRCECIANYKRDENGNCIPIENCPGICPFNEQYSNCTKSLCRAQYCTQSGQAIACQETEELCQQGCVCVQGTLRDENGNCIPEDQCPVQQCNAPNEILSCVRDCPPEKTCKNREIQFNCLQDYKPCQQKCICKEGYFRNSIKQCISGDECDRCKGENEFFSCGQECDNVCKDLAKENRTSCPKINIQCNPMCYCDDGFARDDYGKCVPINSCP